MSWTASARKTSFGLGLRLEHLAELLVVGVALGDRALEDRRVRRDADDALVDEAGEVAVLDERRERKSIQTLWPWAESCCRGVSGMEPPTRGAEGFSRVAREDAKRRLQGSATRARRSGKRPLSASAPGELAQPGGDGLLVAPGLAPAGGARLARGDRVRRAACVRGSASGGRTPKRPSA